eukprot:c33964_g1_i1.p1 GENE.c33964_g1_i1~~c33964_g1_i1.p1  ORF type:complete len:481 (-),score=156.66 c33964_g1_i1:2-1444(-)
MKKENTYIELSDKVEGNEGTRTSFEQTVLEKQEDKKSGYTPGFFSIIFHNRSFALCWIGETLSSMGNWFTLIAFIDTVQQMYPGNLILVSLILITKMAPSALLIAVIGSIADKVDKRQGSIICNLLAAITTFSMAFIKSKELLPVLYFLLFVQNALYAIYDPLRRSLFPLIVSKDELRYATTIDTLSWSVMAAVGASIGGYFASYFGTTLCFYVDGATYIVAAISFFYIKMKPKSETILEYEDKSGAQDEVYQTKHVCCTDLIEAYYFLKKYPHFLAYALLKSTGSLSWNAADIIYTRLSFDEDYHTFGDSDATLGIVYGMIGLGCLFGPFMFPSLIKQSETTLLYGSIVSFLFYFTGYIILMTTKNIILFLIAIFVRSAGSNIIWINSSLLLQFGVPNRILGRILAFEMSLFTLLCGSIQLFTGYCYDVLNLSTQLICFISSVISLVLFIFWVIYYKYRVKEIERKPETKIKVVGDVLL